MSYTPGPWKVADESGNMGEAYVIEAENRTVAWTADSLGPDDEGVITQEDKDNAEVIASAPTLLEMLDNVSAALETMLSWESRERRLMFPDDFRQRERLCAEARALCDKLMGRDKVCCPECGSNNVGGPDFEGLYDCGGCGIWFNLNEGMVKRPGDHDHNAHMDDLGGRSIVDHD